MAVEIKRPVRKSVWMVIRNLETEIDGFVRLQGGTKRLKRHRPLDLFKREVVVGDNARRLLRSDDV
jgi:hypothetical protein